MKRDLDNELNTSEAERRNCFQAWLSAPWLIKDVLWKRFEAAKTKHSALCDEWATYLAQN